MTYTQRTQQAIQTTTETQEIYDVSIDCRYGDIVVVPHSMTELYPYMNVIGSTNISYVSGHPYVRYIERDMD